jgi:hypothetical protein
VVYFVMIATEVLVYLETTSPTLSEQSSICPRYGNPPFHFRRKRPILYTVQSQTHMPDTWSQFSFTDIGIALIGLSGLVSVYVVLSTAFGNVNKRELSLKKNATLQSQARD